MPNNYISILKYDIIEISRIEMRGIVLLVQVGGLLGGGGQRVCWPPSQIIGGGGWTSPPGPPSSYAYAEKKSNKLSEADFYDSL